MSGGQGGSDKKTLYEEAEELLELARNEKDPEIKQARLKGVDHFYGEYARAKARKEEITIMGGNIKIITINGVTVSGDLVVADQIENSFNKVSNSGASQDLKDLLGELSKLVAEGSSQIADQDKKKQMVNDLESLSNEAILPKPRKAWYQLSAKGLMDAAISLGSLGTKMVTVVNGILSILDKISG